MAKHGNISPRGEKFRVRLYRPVVRRYVSFTVNTEAEAKQLAKRKYAEFQIEREQHKRGLLIGHSELKFSQLLARYKAEILPLKPPGGRLAYEESLKVVERYFIKVRNDPRLVTIRSGDVQGALAWMRVHGERVKTLKTSTLNTRRAVMSALFSFAVRLELIPSNPVSKVKAAKADPRAWVLLTYAKDADDEPGELERLIGACAYDPMLQLYVLLLAEGGLRPDEPLWLQPDDLDFEAGLVTIGKHHRTKSGKQRQVPLTKPLRDALQAHVAKFPHAPWLLHHTSSHHGHASGDRITSLRKGLKKAASLVAIDPKWHPHDLRHLRVVRWIAEGRNIVLIKEALGHSDLKTTMAYYHLAPAHLLALVEEPTAAD